MAESEMVERGFLDRYWAKVDRRGPDDCWSWVGGKQHGGYGTIYLGGKQVRATRVAIVLDGREIPANADACHTCDNPECVNPRHLWVGSRSANMKDAVRKGRVITPTCAGEPGWKARTTHCPKGHPYDAANTIVVKGNQRRCRACTVEYNRTWRKRRKASIDAALQEDTQ